jgi:uncharacterized protein (DUF1778 family)
MGIVLTLFIQMPIIKNTKNTRSLDFMEAQTVSNKEENLTIRTTAMDKERIATAARITGQKVSQFVLGIALREAEQIIADENIIRLSPEAYQAFVQKLDEAPQDLPNLREQLAKVGQFRQ